MGSRPALAGPFHEGELCAQRLAGEAAEGEANGAMIDDKLMAGALRFIRAQKMAIVSSRDAQGRRWASLLAGAAGFMEPEDRKTLTISIDPAENDPSDVLWENLRGDEHLGVLIIALENRQRLRVNGRARLAEGRLTVQVEESFANCPKYITRRAIDIARLEGSGNETSPAQVTERPARKKLRSDVQGGELGAAQIALLRATDILFLATGHPERGADASHRGGNPGFVEVVDGKTLRIPDYSGNSLFNTLGNLLSDAHFGMLIPDFRSGRMLQLTGTARVNWSAQDAEHCSGGTGRFVEFKIEEWRERALPVKPASAALEYSPYNPQCNP
jgi:uncharacterized protein